MSDRVFVSFNGPRSSGKSLIMRLLAWQLRRLGVRVTVDLKVEQMVVEATPDLRNRIGTMLDEKELSETH